MFYDIEIISYLSLEVYFKIYFKLFNKISIKVQIYSVVFIKVKVFSGQFFLEGRVQNK